jgi:hypothetical protein
MAMAQSSRDYGVCAVRSVRQEEPAMKLLMRRLWLAVSSASLVFMGLALLPQEASAEATFELSLAGPGIFPCSPPCQSEKFEWKGTVTLVTSSSADGTYTGESFLHLDVHTNLFSATSNGLGFVGGTPNADAPAFVTLSNGRVTSFDFYYDDQYELSIFSGLSGFYHELSDLPPGSAADATAILTNVPEPEIVPLMLAGLFLTALVRRSRKSARGTPHRQSESAAKLA